MSDSIDFFYSLFCVQYSKAGNGYLFGINNNQIFHISNFDSTQSLGKRVATNLGNMENLENSGNLKNCQNLWETSGKS